MKVGDTVKITEDMIGSTRVVTGKVEGFSPDDAYVVISQGNKANQVCLADIVAMETITQEVKKTKGLPSKIGVPS